MSFEILLLYEIFFSAMLSPIENSEEAYVSFSYIKNPFLNCVIHLKAAEKVEELNSLLPEEMPRSFWVHEHCSPELKERLLERQFQSVGILPLMTWDVRPVEPPDLRIEKANIATFTDVLATAFHLDQEAKEGFIRILGKTDKIENYLLYLDEKPIGTVSFILDLKNRTGGVFNLVVLPEFQKRGYGHALMHYLMHRAHLLGLEKLILMSSPEAIKLYEKLGFVNCLDIELLVR